MCNQGGIIAVNGFIYDFNVTPIQVVTVISNLKRDNKRTPQQYLQKQSESGFSGELEKAMEELQPTDFHTVTYNSKSQLQPFFYTARRDYTI